MNNKLFAKAGILGLVFGVAVVAPAQSNGKVGLSARVGAQFPKEGDTSFALGLDYKFKAIHVPQAREGYLSYVGVSLDYYGWNSANRNIPLAATYNVRAREWVFSAGLGLDFSRQNDDDKVGIAGQLAVAYDFSLKDGNLPLFAQLKYFIANRSDFSGIGLYVGYRF